MNLCLTIGVSHAEKLLDLPGAITAANEFGAWANNRKFVTKVLVDKADPESDEFQPITIHCIRKAICELLEASENEGVEHFVLHFAGHGVRSGAEQNIWLQSDWYSESRGISVEGLKRQLYRHGIKSISIFSDACRSLPNDIDVADIFADPILPRGKYDGDPPIVDRFNAVGDGKEAYMLNGDGHSPARCVFSTVIYEGLCGFSDGAYDQYLPEKVIPESLALFARQRLKEIGEIYDLKCLPECSTGIPREHATYFERGNPTAGLVPPVWPDPSIRKGSSDLEHLSYWARVREKPHNFNAGKLGRAFLSNARLCSPDSNLVFFGSKPVRVWCCVDVKRTVPESQGTEFMVIGEGDSAYQVLVEYANGEYGSAVVYRDLITVGTRDETGEFNWACTSRYSGLKQGVNNSYDAIAKLQGGYITANEVDGLAASLREAKHINPTLGAISSYLYDYSGDIDSIRRMAHFYCEHSQPIPFDVAYMGMLHIAEPSEMGFFAEVPQVAARPSSHENDRLPSWVTQATSADKGPVAGLWPWLRQGWQFLDTPEPAEQIMAEGLGDVERYLLPSQFSSFSEEGAQILIRKYNMESYK